MSAEGRADFLAANLGALEARLPALADCLRGLSAEGAPAGGLLELAPTPSGDPTARIPGGGWLHSTRDPRAEARRLAEALEPGSQAIVLLGFGLGYAAEAFLEAGAAAVIACEAEPRLLAVALGARDLRAALGDSRLGFILGGNPDAIVSGLELSGASRSSVLGLAAAEARDAAWYGAVRAAAGRWNSKEQVNEATLRRFGRLWVRNLATNLERIASSPGIERLEGLAAGLPALVLAAGPSLDAILPRLGELRRRALVVCVDTALRSLLREGIEPDFLVVVDPQYWNWRHIAGFAAPRSILVSESATWPAVFRTGTRATFLGGSLFPLGRRIESFAGRKGLLGAGGSVATSAWDLARILGAAPIYMAGLDLGYPGGATHARASLFEQRALAESTRLRPASGAQAAALLGPETFEAPAAGGGTVPTDRRMQLYAWWFESRLARSSSPKTYTLGARGLAIPGMEVVNLDSLLGLPDRRERIEGLLAEAAALSPPPAAREGAETGLAALRAELRDIAETARSAAAAAARGRSAFAVGRDCRAELSLLESADERLLGNESRELAAFLLPPAEELVGSRAGDLGESLERSEAIYRKVAEAAVYHLSLLEF